MKKLSFLIIPIFLVIVALSLKESRGPYWLGSNYDPDYSYLLNALNLAQGESIYHIDHPGTTVQLAGSLIIRLLFWIRRAETTDITTDVLLNAELYLNTINWTLIGINAALLVGLGLNAYVVTKQLWLSWLIQALPFFSPLLLTNSLVKVAPEAFLLTATILLTISCVVWLHPRTQPRHWVWGIIFGIIIAFGSVTKLNFLPIFFLPLIFLFGWRQKIVYCLTTISATILFTLPIVQHYSTLINWAQSLISQTGIHGSGNNGIIDWSTFFDNLFGFLYSFGYISLSILFALIILIWRRQWQQSKIRLLSGIVFVMMLGFALISKQPLGHYFLPYTGLTSLLFFLIALNIKKSPLWFQLSFIGLVIGCFGFTLYTTSRVNLAELATRRDIERVITQIEQTYSDYIVIHYFRSSSPVFALKFGSNFAGRFYDDDLRRLYPNFYYYEISNNTFYQVDTPITSDELLRQYRNRIILTGTSFATGYKNEPQYKPPFPITDVIHGTTETIYTVDTVK